MAVDVEALARRLATEDVEDWLYSDRWWGQFDSSNPDEYEAQVQLSLPDAREQAIEYLRVAGVEL